MEVNSRLSRLFLPLVYRFPFVKLNSNFTSIGKGIPPFELYNRVSRGTVKRCITRDTRDSGVIDHI